MQKDHKVGGFLIKLNKEEGGFGKKGGGELGDPNAYLGSGCGAAGRGLLGGLCSRRRQWRVVVLGGSGRWRPGMRGSRGDAEPLL